MRVLSGAWASLVLFLCLGFVLAVVSCGGRPGSPEAVFEAVTKANERGETGKIWDLLTEDSRANFRQAIDGYRDVIRRNPNDATDKIFRQYHCERAEILTLPYDELFRRENLGREKLLVGATIKDKATDPTRPNEEVLSIVAPSGKFLMRVRRTNDGYGLVQLEPDPR